MLLVLDGGLDEVEATLPDIVLRESELLALGGNEGFKGERRMPRWPCSPVVGDAGAWCINRVSSVNWGVDGGGLRELDAAWFGR